MQIPNEVWFKLPMPLRRRWWDETDLNKREPSLELLRAVEEAAAANNLEIAPAKKDSNDHAKD